MILYVSVATHEHSTNNKENAGIVSPSRSPTGQQNLLHQTKSKPAQAAAEDYGP
jgi:hypothetical protein